MNARGGLFASDNWFVDFDNDLLPELALGRLPAMTEEELDGLVDKIIAYESVESAEWQNRVLLVADNPDTGGNFTGASESVAGSIPDTYEIVRAYLGEGTFADTKSLLLGGLNDGVAFMNYFGHSGLDRMAGEGLLKSSDVSSLANGGRQPIVTSMSCMMGRFALPGYDSLGEVMLMSKLGGSIAVWAPTGLSMNYLSRLLGEEFYGAIFNHGEGVLGDAILTAMHGYAARTDVRYPLAVYGLLGDPALRITGRPQVPAEDEPVTLENWKRRWYSAKERSMGSAVVGNGADPDGDGMSNIEEYTIGRNPRKVDDTTVLGFGTMAAGSDKDRKFDAEVFFIRNKLAVDTRYLVETSTDLITWHSDGRHVTETVISENADGVTELVRVRLRVPGHRRCFVRLSFQEKP